MFWGKIGGLWGICRFCNTHDLLFVTEEEDKNDAFVSIKKNFPFCPKYVHWVVAVYLFNYLVNAL